MIEQNWIKRTKAMLLAGVLSGGIFVVTAGAQSNAPSSAATQPETPSNATVTPRRTLHPQMNNRARMMYEAFWGVDNFTVKAAESGELIRFSYRVVDAQKAKMLNDKELSPTLTDPEKGVQLVVPAFENVGVMRQTATPEAGKTYWMAFSNPGRRVRPGDVVYVEIGHFRADWMMVQ